MKTTNVIGWAGIALLLNTLSCAKSPEGFCESWVEDTCKAIAGCCKSGRTYDADECRLELSQQCQDALDVEQIHSGERVFNGGAASDCFGTIEKCDDLDALTNSNMSYDRQVACKNMVTGFRPAGAACNSDKDCEVSGEYAFCYSPGQTGVCVNVVLDEEKCSFSFETNELLVCPEGKFCDLTNFKPSANAPPTSREYEFAASCRPNIGSGGKCVTDDGQSLPCAKGLFCDFTGGNDATCKARKAAGTTCNISNECADGLVCDANPNGMGETCQAVTANGPFCFSPAVCGDGDCNGNETPANCAQDCGGGGSDCGDGFCDANIGESVTCPQDCCGDGVCDVGETSVCPGDCAP